MSWTQSIGLLEDAQIILPCIPGFILDPSSHSVKYLEGAIREYHILELGKLAARALQMEEGRVSY